VRSLVFVGDRCCDHSPSSGYDQLATVFPNAGWLSGRSLRVGTLTWIRPPAGGGEPLFHVLYGDCSGSGLPALLRARWPHATIVSTFHKPVEGKAGLDSLDGVLTVCREQESALVSLGVNTPIYTVPHGVWTDVFRALPDGRLDRDEVLLVGTFLRDWPLARQVLGVLARAGIRSRVLGAEACTRLAVDHPLVKISPQVAEDELVRLYDRAAALFLPVVGATASNALLEAIAVGCPVVSPRIRPLVEEYLGDDTDAFAPHDDHRAVALLRGYVVDPGRRNARSPKLIQRARRFDWSRLRTRYVQAYRSVLASGETDSARL
jgi:glycosyltransferase involved in cell wall biosynthesis